VKAVPNDNALRLHLAEMLISHDLRDEAIGHIAAILAQESGNQVAMGLMTRALSAKQNPEKENSAKNAADSVRSDEADKATEVTEATDKPAVSGPAKTSGTAKSFDWSAAESQLTDAVPPPFLEDSDSNLSSHPSLGPNSSPGREKVSNHDEDQSLGIEPEDAVIRLADVGGMTEVKKRLNAAFLEPMRNPKLRALFGKSLRGGLLLYGPPGCGKTFIAKAVAGELGAKFLAVGLNDVLDMWLGKSENNVHNLFVKARQNAPCVLFFDELDGIGQKRSQLSGGGARNVVNQLLTEMDGVNSNNDGVFVLAATNAPWDVDIALRRPGRFDRTVLVLPPDEPARKSILEYHLKDRPIAGINLITLARKTEGLSGADLAYLCEAASERALMASVESGEVRMIDMDDLMAARREISSTTGAWFASARNVVTFANTDGLYDDLVVHMKKQKML